MEYKFDNNIPIFIQIVDNIKIDIISGRLTPGDRLLSVRDLSDVYKVNPNTIVKALGELEDIGLIYTERTNGKFVTNDIDLINKYKSDYANNLCNKFINNMNDIGLDKKMIINILMNKEEE